MNEKYMELALELAKKGLGRTSPNPMVGAVVVKDNQIVGKSYHAQAGKPHAEPIALQEAGSQAEGADLYVTLEPCNHFGRTPPCTEAIIRARIKNVYVATLDPNPLVAGKGVERLQKAGIKVVVGIKEKKAKELNEVFIKYITTGMPFVALKGACSLDGKIATREGHSQWITGKEAREYGHKLRDTYDAIMVGVGTILADNPQLTCRLQNSRDPIRVIVDSKLSIDTTAKILNLDSQAPTIIAATNQAPLAKQKELQKNAEILLVNDGDKVDLAKLFKLLVARNITSILVEGGATVNGSLVAERLIDKFYLFYAPLIVGGTNAPSFIGGLGPATLDDALRLKDLEVERIGKDYMVKAYPIN